MHLGKYSLNGYPYRHHPIGIIMSDDGPQFADEMVDAGNFEDADFLMAKEIAEVIKLA